MDALKGFAEKAMHGGSSSSTGNNNAAAGTTNTNAGAGAGQQDYLDKGVAAAEKKFGFSQSAQTNEKVTDSAREFFEKKTGKDIPDKFSN